jgi:hypothetical protein
MKKILPALLPLLFCIIPAIHAQIANSKWEGTVKMDTLTPVTWHFAKDTVWVVQISDNSLVETMTYKTEHGYLYLTKITGVSSCDTKVVGKYKFEIRDDKLYMTVAEDACEDRSSAINSDPYQRVKTK